MIQELPYCGVEAKCACSLFGRLAIGVHVNLLLFSMAAGIRHSTEGELDVPCGRHTVVAGRLEQQNNTAHLAAGRSGRSPGFAVGDQAVCGI